MLTPMKFIRTGMIILAFPLLVSAQPVSGSQPLELSLESSVNISQNAYSTNWDGTEQGGFTWVALVNGRAQRQVSASFNSRTNLRLEYGQAHIQDGVTRRYKSPTTASDRIDLESILRATVGLPLDPYISGRFQSNFLDVRDPASDHYINPLRFTESIGLSRALVKTESSELLARAGFAMRETLDRNALLDPVTNKRGSDWTHDGGLELIADYKTPLLGKRVTYNGRLSLYQALFYSEADKLVGTPSETDWRMVDVELESTFSATIAGGLSTTLDLRLLYDRQVSKGGRLKQGLALGFGYTFI